MQQHVAGTRKECIVDRGEVDAAHQEPAEDPGGLYPPLTVEKTAPPESPGPAQVVRAPLEAEDTFLTHSSEGG